MDLEYGQEYEAFRQEVRSFLDNNKLKVKGRAPSELMRQQYNDWLELQIEHGYWARTIPKEYGGYGAEPDLMHTVIMDEEFNRAGVMRGSPSQGPSMLVPTLLEHGTEEQK